MDDFNKIMNLMGLLLAEVTKLNTTQVLGDKMVSHVACKALLAAVDGEICLISEKGFTEAQLEAIKNTFFGIAKYMEISGNIFD